VSEQADPLWSQRIQTLRVKQQRIKASLHCIGIVIESDADSGLRFVMPSDSGPPHKFTNETNPPEDVPDDKYDADNTADGLSLQHSLRSLARPYEAPVQRPQ
jgi:hypothetical protein